ncbi:hypothetical protein [Paenibacillus anaericanus]|uniref:hypothetical protein n=1 Tax=Paenibacillus anaericanus TaxID=170367 RepID=UPI0027D8463C|nr:hypothetical protein [Paenibacillus anaericanus]
MYKELDNLLSADTTVDSWCDDGCVITNEILAVPLRWMLSELMHRFSVGTESTACRPRPLWF